MARRHTVLHASALAEGSSNGFKHPADNVRESVPILPATVCSVAKVEARFSSGRVRQTDEQLPRASEGAVSHSDHMFPAFHRMRRVRCLFERHQTSHRWLRTMCGAAASCSPKKIRSMFALRRARQTEQFTLRSRFHVFPTFHPMRSVKYIVPAASGNAQRYPLLLSARKRGESSSAARSRALPARRRRQVLAGQMRAACTRWRAGTQQSHPPSFARTALHAQHPPGAPNHQRSRQCAGVARAPCSLLARPGRLQQLVPEHTEVVRTFARTDSMRAFQHGARQ